ncbi:MAG TPA: SRPBCC domain-containing protein [Vicinamibacterales bacterium]|jgi:uncharacterized protein YndB with AHSA1/START domain
MSNAAITYVIHVAATSEQLWNAMTSAEALAKNWGRIESTWTKGAPVSEVDESGRVLWRGEVRRSEPPRVLSYTFDVIGINEPATDVTVEIGPPASPTAPGSQVVQLRLTQSGFADGSQLMAGCARAWPEILSSVKTYLETGRPLGFAWKH